MAFGLRLNAGVTLQVDEAAAGTPLGFSTCVPAGCLVPFVLDASLLDSLRGGKTLTLAAVRADDGQAVRFRLSLTGFATAFERARTLSQ